MPELSRVKPLLVDAVGRQICYLRLSVTDRCDLRCVYCMPERMTFLPRRDLLTIDELAVIAHAFIDRGVTKIRLTGGEPLVRPGVVHLIEKLGERLGAGLHELTLTTNATRLPVYADQLYAHGVRRINVSLDTLNPERYRRLSRRGSLQEALEGIEAAQRAGLRVKINTVVLGGRNTDEIERLVGWCHQRGMDITLIEVMPLGETGESRFDQHVRLSGVRDRLAAVFDLEELTSTDPTGGPSHYVRVRQTGGRIGFIAPLTDNFCAGCNRVRVACTGRIYMCLGHNDHVDLRDALRQGGLDAVNACLDRALAAKPEKHRFRILAPEDIHGVDRHMSTTGG